MKAETKEYKGHNIVIEYDENPPSPRENDNICVFHIGHSRYAFGDENYNDIDSIMEAQKQAIADGDIVLPLYMYEHGGITISLGEFGCCWDSGQCGFIQVPKKTMIKEFGKKIFTKALKAKALDWAKMEVEEMDKFVRGEVFGYIVDNDDSCWGYYSIDDAMEEAEGIVDWIVKTDEENRLAAISEQVKRHLYKLKGWLKNNVPMRYRKPLLIDIN